MRPTEHGKGTSLPKPHQVLNIYRRRSIRPQRRRRSRPRSWKLRAVSWCYFVEGQQPHHRKNIPRSHWERGLPLQSIKRLGCSLFWRSQRKGEYLGKTVQVCIKYVRLPGRPHDYYLDRPSHYQCDSRLDGTCLKGAVWWYWWRAGCVHCWSELHRLVFLWLDGWVQH